MRPDTTILLHLNAAGDVVAATAAAAILARRGPLAWYVSPTCAPLLAGIPCEVLPAPEHEIRRRHVLGAPAETLWPLARNFLFSLAGAFPRVVNLHDSLASALVAAAVRAPSNRGWIADGPAGETRAADAWTEVLARIDTRLFLTHAERYTLRAGVAFEEPPRLHPPAADIERIAKALPEFFVALQPGSGWLSKSLGAKQAAGIVREAARRGLGPFVLLGAPGERGFLDEIAAECGAGVLSWRAMSLADSLAALTLSRGVMTTDTWAMHVAGAVGRPSVFLLGPTRIFPAGTAPALGLSPSDGPPPSWRADDADRAIERIAADAAVDALEEVLGGARAGMREGLSAWRRAVQGDFRSPFLPDGPTDHGTAHADTVRAAARDFVEECRRIERDSPGEPQPASWPDAAHLSRLLG